MSTQEINYQEFQTDWWDALEVTAEEVKAVITKIIDDSFGPGGVPAIQRQAVIDASVEHYRMQQALKAAAVATNEAIKYADVPDSPLYQNAVANAAAAEREAARAISSAAQIMKEAGTTASLVNNLGRIASALGPAINIIQLGAAAATGDTYEVGQKAVSVLAGMAVGSLTIAVVGAASWPVWATALAGITIGLTASKFWEWMWENGSAEYYGIKKGDEFSFSRIFDSFRSIFTTASSTAQRRDPLILDRDNDGAETIGVDAGAYFDHDANGFAEQTGWVSPDDGLLVRDINNDGIINNGRELFGDNTLLKDGSLATDGLQALADLDDNKDGKVDASDSSFNQLRGWKDINSDGISTQANGYRREAKYEIYSEQYKTIAIAA